MTNLLISLQPRSAKAPSQHAIRQKREVEMPAEAAVELQGKASGVRRPIAIVLLVGLLAGLLYVAQATDNEVLAVLLGFLAALPALALALWAAIELGTGLSFRDFISFVSALGQAVGNATHGGKSDTQAAPTSKKPAAASTRPPTGKATTG